MFQNTFGPTSIAYFRMGGCKNPARMEMTWGAGETTCYKSRGNSRVVPLAPLDSFMPNRRLITATIVYVIVLAAFWIVAEHFSLAARLGHMPSTFTAFGLALAPYWYFGFGLAELLQKTLATRVIRLLTPGSLSVPYLIYSIPC